MRNPNGVIMPIMLQTEDELAALKNRIEESVDMYKEVINSFINNWSTNLCAVKMFISFIFNVVQIMKMT